MRDHGNHWKVCKFTAQISIATKGKMWTTLIIKIKCLYQMQQMEQTSGGSLKSRTSDTMAQHHCSA